jgi:hypothetical protein
MVGWIDAQVMSEGLPSVIVKFILLAVESAGIYVSDNGKSSHSHPINIHLARAMFPRAAGFCPHTMIHSVLTEMSCCYMLRGCLF